MRSKVDKKKSNIGKEYCVYCGNEVYTQDGKWVWAYPDDEYPSPVHKKCLLKRTI